MTASKRFFFFFLLLSYYIVFSNHLPNNCSYTPPTMTTEQRRMLPEVFFINMDRSTARRTKMEQHLQQVGFQYRRVRGIEPRDLYIPTDVIRTWTNRWCMLETAEQLAPKITVQRNLSHPLNGYSFIVSALCGRYIHFYLVPSNLLSIHIL